MIAQVTHSIQFLQLQAASLLLYQSVLQGEIGQTFTELLWALRRSESDGIDCLRAYGAWFSALVAEGLNWQSYLISQILQAENPFTQRVQQVDLQDLPPALIAAVQQDLRALQSLYACSGKQLSQWVQSVSSLASAPIAWDAVSRHSTSLVPAELEWLRSSGAWAQLEQAEDWADVWEALTLHYRQFGSGQLASYRAFRWQQGQLVGIRHPDPIQLHQLVSYEWQKQALTKNTEALLAGYPALHVLLYGSRGSGKSSLVKALLQQYGDRGLRLVEVAKADLKDLPTIVDLLRDQPQKFIIFVDDLSFEEDDDAYKALKVVLEGNVTARPQNLVVYATSNRRHLIREFFGDRPRPSDADEVHAWDTVQEKLSFSDRFGLTLTFEPADQTTYLEIVRHLASLAQIQIEDQELEFRALQWATRHNGRSGRTARQFVDFLQADLQFPQE